MPRFSFNAGRSVLIALALCALPSVATATTNQGGAPTAATPYVAAFQPEFVPTALPHLGEMQLVIAGGTITGTYRGLSVAPDPLYDRIVPVTGAVDAKGGVELYIGNALSFVGKIDGNGVMSGTATGAGGGFYDFMAKPGSLSR
ncbi:MAG TPA: hypothetical protein VMF61_11450 [Candidatus Acidoferrales bacterium]|nr:hypothetical protein [Candidatus Acidoferrales bacterium]